MTNPPTCELCGEPMPEGESMFKYHGYSGPCPVPPKSKKISRSREWQINNRENGFCTKCKNKPSEFCAKHTFQKIIEDNPAWFITWNQAELEKAKEAEGREVAKAFVNFFGRTANKKIEGCSWTLAEMEEDILAKRYGKGKV